MAGSMYDKGACMAGVCVAGGGHAWQERRSLQRTVSILLDCILVSNVILISMQIHKTVADLHSKILDARPPWGSKFFQFHAVFGKFWQNHMLAPPLVSWRPLLGEILDPPL